MELRLEKRTFRFHQAAWAAAERKRGVIPQQEDLTWLTCPSDAGQGASPSCSPFNRVYGYKRTCQQTASWNLVLFSSFTLQSKLYHFQGQRGFGTAKAEKATLAFRTFGVIYSTYCNCVYVRMSAIRRQPGRLHSLPHFQAGSGDRT